MTQRRTMTQSDVEDLMDRMSDPKVMTMDFSGSTWVLQGDYGQGWEDVTAGTLHEVQQNLKEYRENMPEYTYRVKQEKKQ